MATLRSTRPRDVQRSACYNWENELFTGQPQLAPRQLRALLVRVWKFAGFPADTCPELVFSRSYGRSAALAASLSYGSSPALVAYKISLARWGRSRWVLLHEAAHCIVAARRSAPVAGHGPEWLSVYLRLLERFGRTGYTGLRASAKSYGLRVASAEVAERQYLRRPTREPKPRPAPVLRALTEEEAEREYENAALREALDF